MDEIVNAVCLNIAQRQVVQPTDVQVELSWDEEPGYGAEVWVHGRSQQLNEANLIEAVIQYMYSEYDTRVFSDQVTLDLDEEITAIIKTN